MYAVIVNRRTCKSGWKEWAKFLDEQKIRYQLYHSFKIEDVTKMLDELYTQGQRKFLFAGGDGTIHHGVNILLKLAGSASYDITMGVLPCGTGNDWIRSFGVDKNKLAEGLREEYTAPMNVVKVTWPDGRIHYGINMVGGALDAAVVANVKRVAFGIPSGILYPYWLFRTLLKPHKWEGSINVDGHVQKGNWLTMQAGFGKYCGGGMFVLPHAREDSPALLLMKPKSLLNILLSTPSIYSGKIIHDKKAIINHFETIEISHLGKPIPLEADGEFMGYTPVRLEAKFDVMKRIV